MVGPDEAHPHPSQFPRLKLKPLGIYPQSHLNEEGGSCDGSQGKNKRIHLLSWQEICSLDSVAADIMISFPLVA